MQLSKRLSTVAEMVTPGFRLIDVGTDHAYVPIYLVQEKKIPSAIAADVKEGPLARAREHIAAYRMENYIETRKSDGLSAFQKGEGDSLLIAGMGGGLTVKILSEGEELLSGFSELILEPQSDVDRVRAWICDHGFRIEREAFLVEDGKYYPVIRAVHGTMDHELSPEELFYGPCLLEQKDPVLKEYLLRQKETVQKLQEQLSASEGEKAKKRLCELKEKEEIILCALKRI